MIEVNDKEFHEKVLKKSLKIPVVVNFWTPLSTLCKILNPILEKLEKEYRNKFILAKVNVDENRGTAKSYEIKNTPSVKIIKEGKVVAEISGSLPEEVIREWLDRNL